jgi:hypothetical protein
MSNNRFKILKYFVIYQIALLLCGTVFAFFYKPDYQWLFFLVPLLLWLFLLVAIQKRKEIFINIGLFILLILFASSIFSLIKEFNYLHIAQVIPYGLFVILGWKQFLD